MPKKTSKADAGAAAAPAATAAAPANLDASPDAARTRLGAVGRNDECPCNSGKKYKKCHMLV
jgi:uncharacterized protein YecA (UPF0149 family)